MPPMSDYRNLDVWRRAHGLTVGVYSATSTYPVGERFGLATQTRRAAVSIPSNIAEGAGRDSDRDFAKFVAMAVGSSNETEYQLLLAHELGYLATKEFEALSREVVEIRSMLIGLRQWLKGSNGT